MAQPIKIFYFPFEGRALPIRLACVLTNTPYENVEVTFEDFRKQREDNTFPTALKQLPYVEIEGKLYTQTDAIVSYIVRKGGLVPADPLAALVVEEIVEIMAEIMYKAPTDADEDKKKALRQEFVTTGIFAKGLSYVNAKIEAAGAKLSVADTPTAADISIAMTHCLIKSGMFDYVTEDAFTPYPHVLRALENFYALDAVKAYFASTSK